MAELKMLILFISLILNSTSLNLNEDYCQKVQCNPQLNPNTCIKVESTISLMNSCPEPKICSTPIEDPIIDSYCTEPNPFPFKKLPSLPCESNEECISATCMVGKCQGKFDKDPCNSAFDCNYGKTCRKDLPDSIEKRCLDPLEEGEKCELDTDCKLDCGCMKGVCTKYFSLDNYEETGGTDYYLDFNFCKSGYVSEVGVCMNISLKNEITECSYLSPCEYEYNDENNEKQSMTIHSNCLCGYNPLGKKYCLIGSGNRNYTKYLEKLKNYHLKNENCHLSERTAEGCQKDLLFGSKEKLNQIHELINAKYWAKANNRLIDAPECVFNVELPNYDRNLDINQDPEPIPEGKCAKYSCKDNIDGGICAKSNYKNQFEIDVELADVCSKDVKCKLNGEPNDVFYNKTDVIAKCSTLFIKPKYPGEKCEIDSECIYPLNNPSSQFHKCEDGVCNGMDKDDICEDNTWCKVGYYCDIHEGKCKSQLKKGKQCLESKDCKNNLICYEGKCTELFSVEDGKSVPKKESYEFQKKFCESGEVIDNVCVSYSDLENTKVNDDEYKKCEYNSYCEYNISGLEKGRKKFVKCECGYNSEGQGYCPHYHDYSKDDWDEYRKIWREKSDNDCHTESRYNCNEYDKSDDFKKIRNKVEKGHLYYKCVDCAKKVLEGNTIHINKLCYILFGFIILFL